MGKPMTTDELIAALTVHAKFEERLGNWTLAEDLRTAIARLRSADDIMIALWMRAPEFKANTDPIFHWRSGAADPEEFPHGKA